MLHYLIKITDNTIPAVIVMAFLLFFAFKNAYGQKKIHLLCGALLGVLAALVYAVLKRNTGFAVREYYDMGVIIPSVVFMLLFVVTGWWAVNKKGFWGFVFKLDAALVLACLLAYCLPNIMLYPFEFGVGMETIFNTDYLFRVVGYLAGLVVCLLLGLSLYKIAGKLPWPVVVTIIILLLLAFMGQQLLEMSQTLITRRMIPGYKWLIKLVIWVLVYKNWFIYLYAALAALAAIILLLKVQFTALTGANPAQIRKMKAAHRSRRRYCILCLVCLVVVILTVTVLRTYNNRGVELSAPLELALTGEQIVIPLTNINDGNLHRFVYKAKNGTEVRYIIIKKSESAYGVGLDACDICGPTGYYQRKDEVICILCDVVMNKSTIGFPGGCNPVPLSFRIADGNMILETADLEDERQRFE